MRPAFIPARWTKQTHNVPAESPEEDATNRVIIIGAGPSGMATAACLKKQGVPCVILERSRCIASLWKEKTYDRLKMHTAKEYCKLPFLPFPKSFPTFITRNQFIEYLDKYASKFDLQPRFNETVKSANYDESSHRWHVQTEVAGAKGRVEHIGRWLVVATGENAETVMPNIPGKSDFKGSLIHSSQYRNGADYAGKKVLVIGSGNSGMEISLDLLNSGARPSIVVRSPVHILPREVLGISTFSLAIRLMKSFPMWLVDYFLVSYSRLVLGDTAALGIQRPKVGPLKLKSKMGKTPVLDVGTLAMIQSGDIQVTPAVKCITEKGVQYADDRSESFDDVIFATGYKSSVLHWLKEKEKEPFFGRDSLPRLPFPRNWKGKNGLYVAGLCNRGILGANRDAKLIAADVCDAYFAHPRQTHYPNTWQQEQCRQINNFPSKSR